MGKTNIQHLGQDLHSIICEKQFMVYMMCFHISSCNLLLPQVAVFSYHTGGKETGKLPYLCSRTVPWLSEGTV
jgi:hypothetical protein